MKPLKRIFRSHYFWGFVLFLLIARTIIPEFILHQTNKFLATFSETYHGHIEDFDISLLRAAYQMEGLSLRLKQHPDEEFAFIDLVDVCLSRRLRASSTIMSSEINQNSPRSLDQSLRNFD